METEADHSPTWLYALSLVRTFGYMRRNEPFTLASGKHSVDYVDCGAVVRRGDRLVAVSTAMIEHAQHRVTFTHVGGPTIRADPIAHGIAISSGCAWFSVRSSPKPRGHMQWIEGARLEPGDSALLIDDVVTTGQRILHAYERVIMTGAAITGVMPLVDRAEIAGKLFRARGVPYFPLLTFSDLGIPAIR